MPRYRLVVEYDGQGFAGWQRQANGPSIQQALADAVFAFTGERRMPVGAGRTDAGVHALGQVAHVDLGADWPDATVRAALNFHLKPQPIAVIRAARTSDDFHARFDAIERRYLYRIVNRRALLALARGRAWHVSRPLDAAAMADAAEVLVGRHDFSSFRDTGCQARSPIKTLTALDIERDGAEIHVHVRARSFLHRQVRAMVGTLVRVGEGKWTRADVAHALARRDRAAAGPNAPAHGLYLAAVVYPMDLTLNAEQLEDGEAADHVDGDEGGGDPPGGP
ncbi:MAG: tRNA pseudouridine(38-40) synthase TruA [Alphaproteobacteria bacterium]